MGWQRRPPLSVGVGHGPIDAIVWFRVESRGGLGLPGVVEGREEDEVTGVASKGLLDGVEGGLLLRETRDGEAVGVSLGRPATLGDDNVLGGLALEAGDGLEEPVAGLGGRDGAVEEGVGVDGAVIGGFTELGVRSGGDEGVDGNDRSLVTSSAKDLTSLLDSSDDAGRASLSVVDELVSDADSMDDVPVTVDASDNLLGLSLDLAQVPDAQEELHSDRLGS